MQCLHSYSTGAEQWQGAKAGHFWIDAEIRILLPVLLDQASFSLEAAEWLRLV